MYIIYKIVNTNFWRANLQYFCILFYIPAAVLIAFINLLDFIFFYGGGWGGEKKGSVTRDANLFMIG
jgi:hypothetical protein